MNFKTSLFGLLLRTDNVETGKGQKLRKPLPSPPLRRWRKKHAPEPTHVSEGGTARVSTLTQSSPNPRRPAGPVGRLRRGAPEFPPRRGSGVSARFRGSPLVVEEVTILGGEDLGIIMDSTVGPDGFVYLADTSDMRVVALDRDGTVAWR